MRSSGDKMNQLISIIVPVYNVEKYLEKCVNSICNQTYKNLEILLIDDESNDGSSELCDKLVQRDYRIKVIHKKNGGSTSARNVGLKASCGKYIGFVDSDDWIEPDMYERMYHRMTTENVDIVMCGRYEDVGNTSKEVYHGVEEGRYGKQELMQNIYPKMIVGEAFFEWCIFPGVWDKLFRRECVERFQLAVDERIVMGEDAACAYPALLHADSIYIMHECLYHYRQTTSSIVKRLQDYEREREQFRVLYQSVDLAFQKDGHIYDLRQQWKKYVLFLMIPRSDGLYRGYEQLDFLFPFPGVKKGSTIVLYGAGTYGQRLYTYLEKTGFCKVVAWVDRNFEELQKSGLAVVSPTVIPRLQYDAIVIANTYEKSRMGLYNELITKYPQEKIHLIDTELIFSKETMQAFGLENE